MMSYLRKNAYNNGGTFENTDLLWYAKAVGVMKSKPISDATSWWFYAAIHGQYLIGDFFDGQYPNWKKIPSIPASANLASMDTPNALTKLFWNQCQHGSWFFCPWHRGYLAAIESILRNIIVNELHGPADWALPYWNYLNPSKVCDESHIPPAFTQAYLPDGTTPNPLCIAERYGPEGDGNIYIVLEGEDETTDKCQTLTNYSGAKRYGGPETQVKHSRTPHGKLESNPHDNIHVMVGGFNHKSIDDDDAPRSIEGLMADPQTAALDPIFYIHHCNIDRMWAAWNETGHNKNPNDPNWLAGPNGTGERDFAMPMDAKGTVWAYNSEDVNSTTINYYGGVKYQFTYDDLSLTSKPQVVLLATLAQRLAKLGADTSEKEMAMATNTNTNSELVGASSGALILNSGITETSVQLDNESWKLVSNSLSAVASAAPAASLPNEVYLKLEDVTGINNSNFLSVYVNNIFVESVALFGIRSASMENSEHGGSGLTFEFDITNIVDELHLSGGIDVSALKVQIKTKNPILGGSELKIGSMRVYRLSQ